MISWIRHQYGSIIVTFVYEIIIVCKNWTNQANVWCCLHLVRCFHWFGCHLLGAFVQCWIWPNLYRFSSCALCRAQFIAISLELHWTTCINNGLSCDQLQLQAALLIVLIMLYFIMLQFGRNISAYGSNNCSCLCHGESMLVSQFVCHQT